MIDPAQIRAARGLLDWNQAGLGKVADISVNWISRIEHGEAGSIGMLEKIQGVFEKFGVEFLPRSGVRKKDIVEIYEGNDSERRLIDDIQKTLLNASGQREILIAHLKEDEARINLSTDGMDGTEYIEKLIRERREAGITHRLLVRADDQGLFPSYDTYHIMPDKYFSDHPLYIYAS
jgi:transcriptional regulator with XRE-family HTH domain